MSGPGQHGYPTATFDEVFASGRRPRLLVITDGSPIFVTTLSGGDQITGAALDEDDKLFVPANDFDPTNRTIDGDLVVTIVPSVVEVQS